MSGKPLRVLGIEIDLSGEKAKAELAAWNREVREAKGVTMYAAEGINDMAREMMNHAKSVGISAEQLKKMRKDALKKRELAGFAEKYGLNAEQIKRMGSESEKTKSKVQGLKGVMGGLAAISIGAAVKRVGGEMLDLAMKMEQSKIQFEVMLKSPEKAKETLEMLQEFSDVTPFSDAEAVAAGRQLVNAQVPLDELKQTLTEIGDVAAGSGIAFEDLTQIYTKNKLDGIIQGIDINQLAGRGLPIRKELAKIFNVGTDEIKGLAGRGAIHFEHLRQAFANMSKEGGFYAGAMDKLSKSGAGLASTFASKLDRLKTTMGLDLLEGLKPLLSMGIEFLGWLQKSKVAMGVLRSSLLFIIPVIGTLLVAALMAAATAAWVFVAPFIPIIAIVALVGAAILGLILVIEDLYGFFTGKDSVIGKYFERFRLLFFLMKLHVYTIVTDVIKLFKSMPDKIVLFFESIPDRIMSIVTLIKEKLKNLIPAPVMSLLVKTGFLEDKKQIQARARGGSINAGEEYLVGEEGPELFRSDRAGTIIPNHALGSKNKNVIINMSPVFNISGASDPEAVASLAIKKLGNMMPLVAAELGFGLSG